MHIIEAVNKAGSATKCTLLAFATFCMNLRGILTKIIPHRIMRKLRVSVQISENHGSKCTSSVSSTIVNINKLPLVLLFAIIQTHSNCHSDVSELLTNKVIHDLLMTHIECWFATCTVHMH